MRIRRELLVMGVALLLAVGAVVTIVMPTTPVPTPSPTASSEPTPSPSASDSGSTGLPSADPFVVVAIDAQAQLTQSLMLCDDGVMTVDLRLDAAAVGPVDLFILSGPPLDIGDPVAARDAAERVGGTVVRALPGVSEMTLIATQPVTTARYVLLIGYRIETTPDDPDTAVEIPVSAAIGEVADIDC